MSINVIQQSSKEWLSEKESIYQKFLNYFDNTDMFIKDICEELDMNIHSSMGRYVRKRLREDGKDSNKRAALIKKGEWL